MEWFGRGEGMVVCVSMMLVVLLVLSGTHHRLFVFSCHPCKMISPLYSTNCVV